MPGVSLEVALSEALEIKGCPLAEPEIWGVLCQSVEALQDLFIKDEAFNQTDDRPAYMISPDTLMLSGNGKVNFDELPLQKWQESKYAAPETFSAPVLADVQLEKIYIYGLGMTLYEAADFGQGVHEKLKLSEDLDTLLYTMCENDPSSRITLAELLDACGQLAPMKTNHKPYSQFVTKLYKLVFGSLQNLEQVDQVFGAREEQGAKAKTSPGRKSRNSSGKAKSRVRSKSWNRGQGGNSSSDSNQPGLSVHNRSRKQNGYRPHSVGPEFPQNIDVHGSNTSDSRLSHSIGQELHRAPQHRHRHQLGFPDPGIPRGRSYHHSDMALNKSKANSRRSHHTDSSTSAQPMDATDNSVPLHGPGRPLSYTGSIQSIYERLRERRRRLEAIRGNMFYDEPIEPIYFSDTYSNSDISTEYGDRRSILSAANSYNQGVFRPDVSTRYGPDVGLQLRMATSPEQDGSEFSDFPLQLPPDHMELRRDRNYRDPKHLHVRPRSMPDPVRVSRQEPLQAGANGNGLPMEDEIVPAKEEAVHALVSMLNNAEPQSKSQTDPLRKKSSKQPKSTPPTHQKDAQSHKQRKFYGPEFIAKSSDPHIRLTMPNTQNLKNINSLKPLKILLLNGLIIDLVCQSNTTGKRLFDLVANHLALPEHYYFGLTYITDGEHMFLNHDTKLSKVAPTSWKEQKGGTLDRPFTLYLRVKFYCEDISQLRHSSTKHLYYLQLRRDILEERTQCNEDDTMQLASIALQAEYGNYDAKTCGRNYFLPEHYVPPRIMRRVGTAFVKDKLPSMHRSHHGVGELEAELLFLKEMQQLSEYGIHFYKIFKSKQDRIIPTWVGVNVSGISIAEKQGDTRVVLQRHPWSQTKKLSFNRKRFSVLPKSDTKNLKIDKLSYYTDSHRKGRYLLQFSTQQHDFQMREQTRSNIADMIDEEMPMDYPEAVTSNHDVFVDEPQEPDFEDYLSDQEYEDDAEMIEAQVEHGIENAPQNFADASYYQNAEAYVHHNDRKRGLTPSLVAPTDSSMHFSDHSSNESTPRIETSMHSPDKNEMEAFVVDASVKSVDQTLFPTGLHNETVSDTLHERFNNLPPAETLERRVIMVSLTKDREYGIGITIVGGESTSKLDLGIFIKSITPGGPAETGGQVQAGDRIIAVNGKSFEGIPHYKAVEIIRDSPSPVQLLVSQPVYADEPTKPTKRSTTPRSNTHTPRSGMSGNVTPVIGIQAKTVSPLNGIGSGEDSEVDMPHHESRIEARDARMMHTAPITSLSPRLLDHGLPLMMGRSPVTAMMGKAPTPILTTSQESESDGSVDSEEDLSDNILDRGTSHEVMATLKYEDRYEVVLQKINGSLGLNVTGGVNTSVRHGGIYVKSMVPHGAADLDNRIHIGDRVLEINDVLLSGVTHKMAVETLRNTPEVCRLVMERGVPTSAKPPTSSPGVGGLSNTPTSENSNESEKDYSLATKENTFVVELDNTGEGFGFSIVGGNDSHSDGIVCIPRIKNIFPNGAAARSHKMEVGDIILDVNDVKVKNLSHNEMIALLRSSTHHVKLKLCRPLAGILPSVGDMQDADASAELDMLNTSTPNLSPANNHEYHALSPIGQSETQLSESEFPESSIMSSKYESPPPDSDANYDESYLSTDYYTDKSPVYSPSRDIDSASSLRPASSRSEVSMSSRESVIRSPLKNSSTRQLSVDTDTDIDEVSLKPGEIEVTLVKRDGGGLGFKVSGGADTTNGCYIKAIVQEPALSNGQLQPGDKLMKVNGTDVSHLGHHEAVNFLRGTPQVVTIRMYRPPSPVETSALITPTAQVDSEAELGQDYPGDSDLSSSEPEEDDERPAAVKALIANLESSKQGLIQPHSYGRKSPDVEEEVVSPRRNAYLETMVPERAQSVASSIALWSDDGLERSESRPYIPQSGVIRLELEKNANGSLGFGVVGGEKGSSIGIFVKSIAPGGPADEDGRLKVGDRLLELNGENLIGMNPNKAVAILRKAHREVSIAVSRPAPSRPNSQATKTFQLGDEREALRQYMAATASSMPSSKPQTPAMLSEEESDAMLSLIDSVKPTHERDYPISPAFSADSPASPMMSPGMMNSNDSDYDLESSSEEGSEEKPHNGYHAKDSSDENANLPNCDVDLEITGPKQRMYADADEESSSSFTDDDDIPLPEGGVNGTDAVDGVDDDQSEVENHRREIPDPVTDDWLHTLPIVKVAENGLYCGKNLVSLVKMMAAGIENDQPVEEYKSLRHVEPTDNCDTAKIPENKPRNRYRNVLPYDANRVTLAGPNNYINASDIKVIVGKQSHHYIACQGPLPDTTGDFWRMVWESRASVIAMTTLDIEGGKVKCHRYWPETIGAAFSVDNRYEVSLSKSETLENFIINTITMRDSETGMSRDVIHLNYTTWPDHGTPSSARPLLQYIRLMHLYHTTGPIVVHCSAGIGRTGALLTIDLALAHMEKDLKFEIPSLVKELREQRQGMIQTKDQYVFCHVACLEALNSLCEDDS